MSHPIKLAPLAEAGSQSTAPVTHRAVINTRDARPPLGIAARRDWRRFRLGQKRKEINP